MARLLGKKGVWDMPVWLIWSLLALVVLLVVIGISSGKMNSLLDSVGRVFG